jgi:glucosamine--fructose-6-phosphate aminotransferase (isomerizing)
MDTDLPAPLKHIFERKAHPYFMWDGIQSIPGGMEDILSPQVLSGVRASAEAMYSRPPVHLMGCGTSFFAAYAIAHAIQQVAGLPAYAWEAFEFLAYPPPGLENSSVVGISHTGSTPPVVRAIEMARQHGARTVGYTDGVPSALERSSEWVVASSMGSEPALPKTRSYLAGLMRGYLQAVELGRLAGRDVSETEAALRRAPGLARQVLAGTESQGRALAETWAGCRRVVVSGGGPHFATAQEGMLKLTEASMFSAVSWEIEEAVHGTWASTVEDDLVVVLALEGPSYESAVRLAGGMKTIGAKVWVLSNCAWSGVPVDAVTTLPGGEPEVLMPLYAILPLYQFAYFSALARHLSPDNMRLSDERFLDARTQMRSSLT